MMTQNQIGKIGKNIEKTTQCIDEFDDTFKISMISVSKIEKRVFRWVMPCNYAL